MESNLATGSGLSEPPPKPQALSQVERILNTLVAPSKTFTDIRRNSTWWLPFLLIVLFSTCVALSVQRREGFTRAAENQIRATPSSTRTQPETPEKRHQRIAHLASFTATIAYAAPLLMLFVWAAYSLLLQWSFKARFAAPIPYQQVLAVTLYSALPYIAYYLLNTAFLLFGGHPKTFDYTHPVSTDLAYFLPDSASAWKVRLLSFIDPFKLWALALQVLGMAIIARKTILEAANIVVGWWLVAVVALTSYASSQ